jgi:hypothetical protein
MRKLLLLTVLFFCLFVQSRAQLISEKNSYTKADTLRGMLTPLRTCYNIDYYHLDVKIDIGHKFISGSNEFVFTAAQNFRKLQFDLFSNMKVEKVIYDGRELLFERTFNAVLVTFPKEIKKGAKERFTVFYSGNPVVAVNPPWD